MRELGYLRGLDEAVANGIEYGLEVIASGEAGAPDVPLPVLTQARLAARHRIPLDRVVRRYGAAKTLLAQFVLTAATEMALDNSALLLEALAAQDAVFERVLNAATEEYERERQARGTSRETRQVERVQRLLDGEMVDTARLEYDFGGWHLGLVARSPDVRPLLRRLAREADARLLTVSPSEEETWAWIGSRRSIDPQPLCRWITGQWPKSTPLGIGEPMKSLTGWRRTHEQARAAVGVAPPAGDAVARYRDVALVAAAAADPLLLASLRDMYLAPLAQAGDRAEDLRRTLRAYFEADRKGSCAAAALGVSRQTVANHLREVEQHIGQPLEACGDSLKTALRLEQAGC